MYVSPWKPKTVWSAGFSLFPVLQMTTLILFTAISMKTVFWERSRLANFKTKVLKSVFTPLKSRWVHKVFSRAYFFYSCKIVLYTPDTFLLSMQMVSQVLRYLRGICIQKLWNLSCIWNLPYSLCWTISRAEPRGFQHHGANIKPTAGGVTVLGTNVFSRISKSDSAMPQCLFVSNNSQ